MTFALWERIALAAIVVASGAVFGRDLAAKIRLIVPAPADRPRTDRIGRRLWVTTKEVLFQTRVIGGRWFVGTLHALVFLGFLVFALETTDHFFEPFGVELLHALLGGALPVFRGVLFVTALLVTAGITGLAIRRFFHSSSPDPKSYSSGVVALLIVVLMLTYLNGALAEPWAPKLNWWVHSLIILVFPHLILRSKHFHILMAPVDIFFRTHHLGDLVSLDLDLESLESGEEVALGLESMADTPWKMRMDFLTCVECKRCTEQCPAWNSGQELSPRAFILNGRKMLGEEGPVVGNVISETALGQCTTCGACENICPVGIEHLSVLIGAKRSQALATGKGMVAAEFLETIERFGNPFSATPQKRQRLTGELGLPLFVPGETEYLLWLGCIWNYNDDARSSLEATTLLLERAGVSYGVLAEEGCSGHHSRRQGEELQFQTLAKENIERLAGATKIIASCPHCLHTFRREYPDLDESFRPEIVHHSELIAQLVADGSLALSPNGAAERGPVTFHDPCYLGRFEGVYDEPREAIRRAGFPLIELERRRERSFCCGGGGAGFTREVEAERRVDQVRKDEIAASGARTLVTACPECKMMLDAAVEETVDLSELVARSLPAESGDPGAAES